MAINNAAGCSCICVVQKICKYILIISVVLLGVIEFNVREPLAREDGGVCVSHQYEALFQNAMVLATEMAYGHLSEGDSADACELIMKMGVMHSMSGTMIFTTEIIQDMLPLETNGGQEQRACLYARLAALEPRDGLLRMLDNQAPANQGELIASIRTSIEKQRPCLEHTVQSRRSMDKWFHDHQDKLGCELKGKYDEELNALVRRISSMQCPSQDRNRDGMALLTLISLQNVIEAQQTTLAIKETIETLQRTGSKENAAAFHKVLSSFNGIITDMLMYKVGLEIVVRDASNEEIKAVASDGLRLTSEILQGFHEDLKRFYQEVATLSPKQ